MTSRRATAAHPGPRDSPHARLPREGWRSLRQWIHEILELGIKDDDILMKAVQEMTGYFAEQLERRKAHPSDDLISTLMKAKDKNGQPLSDVHVLGSLRLLLIAGIDTTWSAIGASLWHLASTGGPRPPDRRAGIVADRDRGIAARLFAGDDGAGGSEGNSDRRLPDQIRKHGAALIPRRQPRPCDVPRARQGRDRPQGKPPRSVRPGIHRCVGSNLARMEMTVAIEEWLKQISDFRLDPAGQVTWSEGTVRGPRQLPMLLGNAA